MIRNNETTRLEVVRRVLLLFRRIFLKINFANFIGHLSRGRTAVECK
jgi:hypothetical protein